MFSGQRLSDGLQVAIKQIHRDKVQQWARLVSDRTIIIINVNIIRFMVEEPPHVWYCLTHSPEPGDFL